MSDPKLKSISVKEVLILTGACGVGKSTVSKLWAKSKKGAVIESDYFTEWIYNDTYERFKAEEELLVADLTFVTAKEYLKHNMPVAIENVWSPQGLEKLKRAFNAEFGDISIKFVWLICEREENHRRDKLRIPENQMKERVDIVNEELNQYKWPDYVSIIDTTEQAEKETLNQILLLS